MIGRPPTICVSFGVVAIAIGLGAAPTSAQPRLYAGLLNTKGYTVGSALTESGLHRYEGDTVWTHVGWNHPRVNSMVADPREPNRFYLAAGNGVLRTLDGGTAWRITTDWEVTESQDVALDPNAPDEVYVATAYGVWSSKDGGDTWRASNEGLEQTYVQSIVVDRERAGRIFAGTWGGLFVSTDGAASWSPANAPSEVSVLDVEQSASDPHVWLAGTQDQGVLLSRDNGLTWEEVENTRGMSIFSVAADPFDSNNFAAAGWDVGVLFSSDGGLRWTRRDADLPIPDIYRVVFDVGQPRRLWAATVEEGIFRSDDLGESWQYAGLNGTLVFHLTFIDGGTN